MLVPDEAEGVWLFFERKADEAVNAKGEDGTFICGRLTGGRQPDLSIIDRTRYAQVTDPSLPVRGGKGWVV